MCSLCYHGTQSVEQVDLELSEIHLHLTPRAGIKAITAQ